MSAAAAAAAANPPARRVHVRSVVTEWGAGGVQQLRDLFAQAGDDPAELWHIAIHSVRLEEAVATGCLLMQAVALVRLWTQLQGGQAGGQAHQAALIQWRASSHKHMGTHSEETARIR